jgi:hypothetical protein
MCDNNDTLTGNLANIKWYVWCGYFVIALICMFFCILSCSLIEYTGSFYSTSLVTVVYVLLGILFCTVFDLKLDYLL